MAQIKNRAEHRFDRANLPSLRNWMQGETPRHAQLPSNVVLDCGWGRLIFAHTFSDQRELVRTILKESPGRRDIAFYLRDPHVVLAMAPQEIFMDPSHAYRLWLDRYQPDPSLGKQILIRRIQTREDCRRMNAIYAGRGMVVANEDFLWKQRHAKSVIPLVAEDLSSREMVGTVMGIDHGKVFNDPENGSSLWCLAVEPQCPLPGVGEALVRYLAEYFQVRGRSYMDLSVMHDNEQAIALYEKVGFQRIPVFSVKHKNAINEPLFVGEQPQANMNPYAMIIIREAQRRGINVEVLDEQSGHFQLVFGGRTIACLESLSEMTSAVAFCRCDDKSLTLRLLKRAGLRVPEQVAAADDEQNSGFLKRHGRVVVKPVRGEQGRGISVDVREPRELKTAVEMARDVCDLVVLESFVEGEDLRMIVIDYKFVAAAVRRPAQVVGTGEHTIERLIAKQSRRRSAATGGESRIPMDAETERCVSMSGWKMQDILPAGEVLVVRKTANLHTGGTIHDVTDQVHSELIQAAEQAAGVLNIPVVGFDFLVPDVQGPDYVVIEANERPGLANHEPQPTAERFVDMLFPQTAARKHREEQ
ncbi:GNAT-family acetyltransferase TIGR03103 [Desulfonatronum thiosulfatophilum]|uniref:GNAT-family acetyltransferase TIGR03103 n=1 Tax=Desulfonatronum thiosulfatophilum TaxID=617002 RepID=A0A1G6DPH7_9BACT|nr:N-acetylglutaminylglutamine synthetase [Desulfonatronum thiosulfatophilum]SDB47039.1 GNAT-family acetyltransferase TIGR03103 [Desulfonatronum thiosulfatophilum]